MPLTPFPVTSFGGLNVRADPTDVGMGGAVSMLNVDLVEPGALITRPGLLQWSSFSQPTPSSHPFTIIGEAFDGTILATAGGTLYALDADDGSELASHALSGAGLTGYVNYGTPSGNLTLITFTDPTTSALEWDGSAFSSPTFSTWPVSSFLTATPWDNRLVGYNGVPSYTLSFSDPDDALTFGGNTTSVVPSDAGRLDGAGASGNELKAHVYQNLLVMVGTNRVFVFYGTGALSDGTPVFDYRTFDVPFADTERQATVTGPDGVYVLCSKGLYRTRGGEFELVSNAVAPYLLGTDPNLTLSCKFSYVQDAQSVGDRLFFSADATDGAAGDFQYILVWDTTLGTWLLWTVHHTSLRAASRRDAPRLYVALSDTSTNVICTFEPSSSDDNGTAIDWQYQTGYSDAGGYSGERVVSSGERKRHHHVDILGCGSVTHQVFTLNARPSDSGDASGGSLTLGSFGPPPAPARGSRRIGVRGTHFSHLLFGSGPVQILSLTYWLANVEQDT